MGCALGHKQSQEHQLCSKVLNTGNRQVLMGLFKGNTGKKKAILEIMFRASSTEPTGLKGSESKNIQETVLNENPETSVSFSHAQHPSPHSF